MNEAPPKIINREVQYKNMINALAKNEYVSKTNQETLKASKLRAIVNSYYFTDAFKNTSKVAFVGEQFPNEILYPFNLISINIETMAALFSKSDNVKEYIKIADEHHLSKDICSNVRTSYGIGLANCYPTPNIAIANTHPCDALSKLLYLTGKAYNGKFFSIDTPSIYSEDSILYLAEQYEKLVHDISTELELEYKYEAFMQIIRYSNEAKKYYLKTLELCQTKTLPLIPYELLAIVESGFWGQKEAVAVCKMLYEEALEKSNKTEKRNHRLLWIGQKPNYSNEILEYFEAHQLEVFFLGALDSSHYMLLDESDPYVSIAKRSIKNMWDPIRFKDDIKNIQEEFHIDGVILLNAWGCRNMLGVNQMLREFIIKNSLKVLTIDIDYMDKDKFAFSQVKNRIDAFIEIL